jgi:uncharacterized protein (UPF0335 family)
MRSAALISERLKPIVAREKIEIEEILEDWEDVLREMAGAGFNVAGLLCDLQTYKADRKRVKV